MGGVRTALYNYLFAKKHGGDFVLRIEDTDERRFIPGAEQYIIDSLKWCGIEPSEGIGREIISPPGMTFSNGPHGPYRQSERKHIYKEYADRLVRDGHAYYAFDTKDDIESMRNQMNASGMKTSSYDYLSRENMKNSLVLSADDVKSRLDAGDPYVIRVKMPRRETIKFKDLIRGNVSVSTETLDDKVLFKSSGQATYHLANIIDDHLMEISHVIRGEEWLTSCPTHIYLYRCFGWDAPEFVHLPLILGPDGKKLSKRDGDKHGFPVFPLPWTDAETGEKFMNYRDRGYLPEAFINMIALLGWNPGGNVEVMSLDEMVEKFSFDRVNKAGAKFDLKKAGWMNGAYMMKTDNAKLAEMFKRDNVFEDSVTDEYLAKVCGLLKEKVNYLDEFWKAGRYFFCDPMPGDPVWPDIDKLPVPEDYPGNMRGFAGEVAGWAEANKETKAHMDHDGYKRVFDFAVTSSKVDARDAGRFLRLALTGMSKGPTLFSIMALLGPEVCCRRIMNCLKTSACLCGDCNGTGLYHGIDCEKCDGTGEKLNPV